VLLSLLGFNNETEGSISGGESQLDIQVMMGVAVGSPTTFWSISGELSRDLVSLIAAAGCSNQPLCLRPPGLQKHTHQEPFLHWTMEIANMTDPPLVHSVSCTLLQLAISLCGCVLIEFRFLPAADADDEVECVCFISLLSSAGYNDVLIAMQLRGELRAPIGH
jgi:hypothetical protein